MYQTDLTYEIVNSADRIGRPAWDALLGKAPEGYAFCKTLEQSALDHLSFHYLAVCDRGGICAIAPLFIADLPLEIPLGRGVKRLVRLARRCAPRLFVRRTLFCGSPFGEQGLIGIRPDIEDRRALVDTAVRALEGFAGARGIPLVIFKDFPREDATFLDRTARHGFLRMESFPSTIVRLDVMSFDEYLLGMRRAKRKDLRRKIKKAFKEGRITVGVADHVEDLIDDVYRLYLNTWRRSGVRFGKLTPEFFIAVGKYLAPNTKYFLYRVDGKLAAFNLCFVHPDILIDKVIGFDYAVSRAHNLYALSWFCNIEWCLSHAIHRYQTGPFGYEAKLYLGAEKIPLYAYLKHRGRGGMRCARAFARRRGESPS